MNSIFLISPYKHNSMWVFDDPARGLDKEPFVAGADTVIDMATQLVPNADAGFNLLFADFAFPGHQIVLVKEQTVDEVMGDLQIGTDYICEQLGLQCWLCPALNKYYPVSPSEINENTKKYEDLIMLELSGAELDAIVKNAANVQKLARQLKEAVNNSSLRTETRFNHYDVSFCGCENEYEPYFVMFDGSISIGCQNISAEDVKRVHKASLKARGIKVGK